MSERRAFIIAARRTAVAPRRGAFASLEAHQIAAPVLLACLDDAGMTPDQIDEVILGNALSGGGNVARLAALAAGLPESVPALTIDRQCCSGLDAIMLAARLIEAGAAQAVLAGGVESWSRSAIRAHRPREAGSEPVFYDRPPFTPWPERDPDMIEVVAELARQEGISRLAQGAFAVESHAKARPGAEIVILPDAPLPRDAFTRRLTPALCARAPVLAGHGECAVDAATVAVEADAAAAVLVVSEHIANRLGTDHALEIVDALSLGSTPEQPATAIVPAVGKLLGRAGIATSDLDRIELMEAFAAQALSNIAHLELDAARVNVGGGALARGHPIGASGAILAVRLFHEMRLLAEGDSHRPPVPQTGVLGLAAIAAAGGLATAMLLRSNGKN